MLSEGANGLQKAFLRSAGGYTAEIYTHGAHVTAWRDPAGRDLIFLSKNAIFKPPTAIRGGIPVCFPQFGDMGPCKAQHGFARNTTFEVADSAAADSVTMVLRSPPGGLSPEYPHPFELRIVVTIGEGWLEQELRVRNTDPAEPMRFTAALHTYFRLRHGVRAAGVAGLKGLRYLDNLQGRKDCTEIQDLVRFPGEVDRIYCGAPEELSIIDGEGRRIEVKKSGFADAVVWNPAEGKAKKMTDFGDDEWEEMVCLEVAQAGSGAVDLPAGEEWVGTQLLRIEDDSRQ